MRTEDMDIFKPIPVWAKARANGDHMTLGAQLCTRDGRHTGNAFVFDTEETPELGAVAHVMTDMGTKLTLTLRELEELYHPPEWVMDVEEATNARS